ncbi:MAG: hypothetical protein PPP58_12060 [Natronomonas sp.]
MTARKPSSDSHGPAPGPGGPSPIETPQPVAFSELNRYDLVLGSIPVLLLLAWVAGSVLSVPLWAAMAAGAAAAVAFLVDALAINPPV